MRLNEYTMPAANGIVSLMSMSFGMSGAEAGVLLADAAENGACYVKMTDDKPVSVALCKPVRLRLNKEERVGTYIFGVCTDPSHRGKGYAAGLIEEVCADTDADYAVLIPEDDDLFAFYERLGFAPNGVGASFNVTASETERVFIGDTDAYSEYLYFAEKCDNVSILSERDLIASGALAPRTAVIGKSGVCFVTSDRRVEAFAPRERVKGLVSSALSLLGMSSASVTAPLDYAPDCAETVRIGMIKPLRAVDVPQRFYINNLYNL